MHAKHTHFDVIVTGGGISGTMAAIAAAREGRRTLLVERYSALGGMATLGLVQPISMWGISGQYVVGGTGKKLLEALHDECPAATTPMSRYGPTCDAEHLKRWLETAALEQGVRLLYHTWVVGVERKADSIAALDAISKGGHARLIGDIYIDATGDADIAAFCDVPCDTDSQGMTLMFIVSGIQRNRCPPRDEISALYEKHKIGYKGLALFWHPRAEAACLNVTEVAGLSSLDPWQLTEATVECRRQAWQVLEVLKTQVPGFEHAYLEQTAPAIGVRESRRIRGRYILTQADVLGGADFPDTIARAGCPVDIHGAAGRFDYRHLTQSYGIPYRCLTTEVIRNLIVTGRPISADHVAHSSIRRMAPGFAVGEAAGIAAALACQTGGDVRSVQLPALRTALESRGAILKPESDTGKASKL